MTINQIRYVLEIANSNSLREASMRLYISQPALSSSISDLEKELGIVLFKRTNKGVVLTDEGQEFLVYAKKAVGQYEVLEERYLSRKKDRERFSVSTQHYTFATRSFANVVKQYNPDKFDFYIHETKTGEVLENVRDLKSEVGIVSYSGANEAVITKLIKEYNLEFVPLMRRETYAYVWKNHPLANLKEISLSDLEEYPCISFDQSDDNNFYLTEEAMADYDFKKAIKSDDRATTLELIYALQGYAVGSGMLSEEDAVLQGLVSIKLKEEDPLVIGYITRKGSELSTYGRSYIEELLKYKEII